MPAGPERLAGDAAAAVVHRLVPDRQHGSARWSPGWCWRGRCVRCSEASARSRQARRYAGELLVISEYQTPRHSPTTPACRAGPGRVRAVPILRFLSGLMPPELIWRGLSPALVRTCSTPLWRFDSARAAFLWLPIAVTGAWGAAVAFSLSRRDASPRAARAGAAGLGLPAVGAVVWLAGGISVQQLPAHVGGQSAFGRAGRRRPAAGRRALSVPPPPRADGRLLGVPLALLILGFWLPSPGGLRAGLAAAGLRPGPAQPDRARRGQPGGQWQHLAARAAAGQRHRVVILELAPVDPRSLMQGDYMALTFAAGRGSRLRKDGSRDRP